MFQCWEHIPHLPSKPPKERKLNKLQLRSSEAISTTSSRKRKAVDKSSTEMGAELVENCVESSETAKEDTNETETELLKLKADILLLTEKLKTANTKIEQ